MDRGEGERAVEADFFVAGIKTEAQGRYFKGPNFHFEIMSGSFSEQIAARELDERRGSIAKKTARERNITGILVVFFGIPGFCLCIGCLWMGVLLVVGAL